MSCPNTPSTALTYTSIKGAKLNSSPNLHFTRLIHKKHQRVEEEDGRKKGRTKVHIHWILKILIRRYIFWAMAAIGWYGPLIDLSKASSHIGDYVQLLVFVHRFTPIQYKLSKGGEVIRTDVHVGDDSRPFFSLSLWQKEMGSMIFAGDVILLQNVKITKFGNVVEARTVQCSCLQRLVHPYQSLVSKGVDDLIRDYRAVVTTKEKLKKVIEWAKQTESSRNIGFKSSGVNQPLSRNWKVHEEKKARDCFSLSEVSGLSKSCKATFYASVGEMFLPFTWRNLDESEKERMFISRRVFEKGDNSLAEDLICTGCQLCGSPLSSKHGSKIEHNTVPLYCQKSRSCQHVVGFVYRPFMLYVWDETEYIPLLVTNKAAELLFGNIGAERVHLCYREQKYNQSSNPRYLNKENQKANTCPRDLGTEEFASSCSPVIDQSIEPKGKCQNDRSPNFYLIWLILLKVLLQQGNNSQLKFEVIVNASLDREDGRFEMVSVSMPC